jgi:hypothetical protein
MKIDGSRPRNTHPFDGRRVLVAGSMLLAVGCGDLQNVTSGHIGCAPSDITISDESSGWTSASWVATCNGKRYFCSGAGGGRYGGPDISCKEEGT